MSELFDVITGVDGAMSVRIADEHPAPDVVAKAARIVQGYAGADDGDDWPGEPRVEALREHLIDGERLEACGCEEVGWFCPEGDGPVTWWLCWDP